MWTRLKTWKRQRASSKNNKPMESSSEDVEANAEHEAAVSVLFVCMGNICRSPMAEGVLRQRLAERRDDLSVQVDSAGTHSYHVGAAPDRRAQVAASRRGVDISALRARRFHESDFSRFDYILAMDRDNLEILTAAAEQQYQSKVKLFLDFSRHNRGADVPDPYYGGAVGFERVLDLVEEAADSLIEDLIRTAARKGRRPRY